MIAPKYYIQLYTESEGTFRAHIYHRQQSRKCVYEKYRKKERRNRMGWGRKKGSDREVEMRGKE